MAGRRTPAVAGADSGIAQLSFDTATLSNEERFAAWRDLMAVNFEVEVPPAQRGANFAGSIVSYHLGTMIAAKTAGSAQTFMRDSRVIARSSVDHYLIQRYTQGGYGGTVAGREITVKAGDVCVLDLAQPVATTASPFAIANLMVPRTVLEPLLDEPDALHGRVLPADSPVGALLGAHLCSMVDRAPGLVPDEAATIASGSAAFIAGCLGPSADASEAASRALRADVLERIKRFIDAGLESRDLGPEAICRAFGISRPNLYRLFEPLGGVAAYIRRRRLARAFSDLVSPERTGPRIIDIALDRGFASEASFSRAFRGIYGISPGEARAVADEFRYAFAEGEEVSGSHRMFVQWICSLMLPDQGADAFTGG